MKKILIAGGAGFLGSKVLEGIKDNKNQNNNPEENPDGDE